MVLAYLKESSMDNMKFRILIIDDNEAIHHDFIKILKTSKKSMSLNAISAELFDDETQFENAFSLSMPEFDFDSALQGLDGIEKVKIALEQGEPYALAFVDICMPPGIDGIQTIKKIWEIDDEIQIVICTAYSDYSWEDTVNSLGVTHNLQVIKKPFDVLAVRQLANALTQKWALSRDTRRHTESLNQLIEQRTESLKASLSLLRATIESSSDGILVVDLDGKFIDYNANFIDLWKVPETILDNKNWFNLLNHMRNQLSNPDKFFHQIDSHQINVEESIRLVLKFKNDLIMECFSKPHRVNDKTIGRVWSFRDISEQTQLKEKLEHQATHDALTNLPNRLLLADRIEVAIANSLRYESKFGILFFDLDRFKLINDSISHETGDLLLCSVARRVSSIIRKKDTLARLGGDEFVMIISSFESEDDFINIAQKILQSFNTPFLIGNQEIVITASIGISIYPTDGETMNTLLSHADLAMYQAKMKGGNQFSFYSKHFNDLSDHQLQAESEIRHAIANNEFFLVYQPQFDMDKNNLFSVEALIRWNHPKNGIINPLHFIPAAEKSNLIIDVGEWVIREACRQMREWLNKGLPCVRVAVNVATKQLKSHDFATTVESILKEYELNPDCLEIEITENVIVDGEIQQMIMQLKKIGVIIVLDDFGTGNSSLNYLKLLKIDRVKIDRSFIANIEKSRGDEVIIEAIIAISKSMSFRVIAEGVETQEQINFLKKRQCDEIQGYLMSKPISATQYELFLNDYKNGSN
jgi:diguanylate cyclase (GGDEF)-like protein/PAS domain S-box-containing protein